MSVKFKAMQYEKSKPTDFGKPTFIKYGKEIDIQEYIEAGREDTEIYPTLLKYGCLKPLERSAEAIYGDFTEYNDLRTCFEKAEKSKEMWEQLPTDIKNHFNNSMDEFIDRGMEWAQNEIQKAQQTTTEPTSEPTAEPKGICST